MILLMHLLPVLDREAAKKPDESRCSLCTLPPSHTKEVSAVCTAVLLGLKSTVSYGCLPHCMRTGAVASVC